MDRNTIKMLTQEVMKRTDRVISEEELQGFVVDFLKEKKNENLLEDSFFFIFLVNEIITELEK